MRFAKFLIASLAAMSLLGCGGGGGGNGNGAAVFIATSDERLIKFELDSPDSIDLDIPITGLQGSEEILGMDFREFDGLLYALGSTGQLYTINTTTGAANPVGSGVGITLTGSSFAFDFNETSDRIRVISDSNQNFRINPNTGAAIDGDAGTGGVQPDTDINPSSDVVACAYTPVAASVTTLYAVDSGVDTLVLVGGLNGSPSPNGGARSTIGPLGTDIDEDSGFDITGNGTAVLATQVGANTTNVFTVNLVNGGATFIGVVDGNNEIAAMAVQD